MSLNYRFCKHFFTVDTGCNISKVECYSDSRSTHEAMIWECMRRDLVFYIKCSKCGLRKLMNKDKLPSNNNKDVVRV